MLFGSRRERRDIAFKASNEWSDKESIDEDPTRYKEQTFNDMALRDKQSVHDWRNKHKRDECYVNNEACTLFTQSVIIWHKIITFSPPFLIIKQCNLYLRTNNEDMRCRCQLHRLLQHDTRQYSLHKHNLYNAHRQWGVSHMKDAEQERN